MLINQSLAAMCKFILSQEIFFVLGLVLQSVYMLSVQCKCSVFLLHLTIMGTHGHEGLMMTRYKYII